MTTTQIVALTVVVTLLVIAVLLAAGGAVVRKRRRRSGHGPERHGGSHGRGYPGARSGGHNDGHGAPHGGSHQRQQGAQAHHTEASDETGVAALMQSNQVVTVGQMLHLVIQSSPTGIVVLDRNGDVMLSNNRAHEMALVHARTVDQQVWRVAASVFDDEEKENRFLDLAMSKRRTGNRISHVRALVKPLTLVDDRFVVVYGTDESENVRMESARRDFVANVSHELKTPVGGMALLAEALLGSPDDPEHVAHFGKQLQREATRMADMVNELISLSKLQGAEALPEIEPVSVNDVIRAAVERNQMAAENHDIALRTPAACGVGDAEGGTGARDGGDGIGARDGDSDGRRAGGSDGGSDGRSAVGRAGGSDGDAGQAGDGTERLAKAELAPSTSADELDSGIFVEGNRNLLVTAVSNLISNAINYSPDATPVTISYEAVSAGEVRIHVADQGIGIAADDQQRVFERFYRVDKARSRQTGGTGLGLAIVKHVIANHGGNISLSSELGEGTTFTLALPRYQGDGRDGDGDQEDAGST